MKENKYNKLLLQFTKELQDGLEDTEKVQDELMEIAIDYHMSQEDIINELTKIGANEPTHPLYRIMYLEAIREY